MTTIAAIFRRKSPTLTARQFRTTTPPHLSTKFLLVVQPSVAMSSIFQSAASAPSAGPPKPDIDIEASKRNAANLAVKEHFPPSASYIGIGSGSTIVFVVEAIKALNLPNISSISFVPTGYQSRQVIHQAGLRDIKFDSLPAETLIDVAFDGADEVDEQLNCIKGGGACLYQEKLVATQARKFVCVAGTLFPIAPFSWSLARVSHVVVLIDLHVWKKDHRKLQRRLLTKWPSIPIEVEPLAANRVLSQLYTLGSPKPTLREGQLAKAGPIKTDQDNFIIDAPFTTLITSEDIDAAKAEGKVVVGQGEGGLWEVRNLALAIKALEGVLSVGIFTGLNGLQAAGAGDGTGGQKPVAAYFGMGDGSVVVRVADVEGRVTMRDERT